MSKKVTSGDGWSFIPAGKEPVREVVSLPPEKQRPKIALEKRAKGKTVTAISGFVLSSGDRKALAKELKNVCGAGGSDDDGIIEIQGDHREKAKAFLTKIGWMA